MRKILLPFAMLGAMSLPMVACDVEDPAGDTTTPDTTSPDTSGDTTPDTVQPDKYFAVIVDDSQIFPTHRPDGGNPCATASSPWNAHGADIDAVGLFDGNQLIGYLSTTDYQEGGLCSTKQSTLINPAEAEGAPNATITENFVTLGGGWLTGEFDGAAEIRNGDTLVVYEVGTKCGSDTSCGGVDEGYEVFVAHDIDCVNEANYPYSSCAIQLSDNAKGETTIPVSGM